MDTATFNSAFDQTFGAMAARNGGFQKGRNIYVESGDLLVGVVRAERRWMPPPQLLALVRHRALRTCTETLPSSPPRDAMDWPVKVRPSQFASLAAPTWTFDYTGSTCDAETVDWTGRQLSDLIHELQESALQVESVLPSLPDLLTPERLHQQFLAQQTRSPWWIVELWIDDLAPHL